MPYLLATLPIWKLKLLYVSIVGVEGNAPTRSIGERFTVSPASLTVYTPIFIYISHEVRIPKVGFEPTTSRV